jgi:hypothetical protein
MKHLRQYIRRILKEEGVLGKWVWPSALKGYAMIDEIDTDIELMLYQQLHNHFGAIAPLNDEAVAALQQILDSGQYTETFVPCKSGPILRGMRLPVSWLEQNAPEAIIALTDKEKDPVDWDPPVNIKPLMYKSEGTYGNVSSWTNDWMAARRFTTQWSPDTVPVILHSDCSTGYFMHTQSFARYKGGRYRDEFDIRKLNPQGKSEKEILLFGECQVTAVQVNVTKIDLEKAKK